MKAINKAMRLFIFVFSFCFFIQAAFAGKGVKRDAQEAVLPSAAPLSERLKEEPLMLNIGPWTDADDILAIGNLKEGLEYNVRKGGLQWIERTPERDALRQMCYDKRETFARLTVEQQARHLFNQVFIHLRVEPVLFFDKQYILLTFKDEVLQNGLPHLYFHIVKDGHDNLLTSFDPRTSQGTLHAELYKPSEELVKFEIRELVGRSEAQIEAMSIGPGHFRYLIPPATERFLAEAMFAMESLSLAKTHYQFEKDKFFIAACGLVMNRTVGYTSVFDTQTKREFDALNPDFVLRRDVWPQILPQALRMIQEDAEEELEEIVLDIGSGDNDY